MNKFKNEYSFKTQQKAEYYKDKKSAAFNFLDSISLWFDYSMKPLNLILNNPTNLEILKNLICDLQLQGSKSTSNYWKLSVYFDEKDILDVSDNLYNECVDLHQLTFNFLIDIERSSTILKSYDTFFLKSKQTEDMILKVQTEENQINIISANYLKNKEEFEKKISISRLRFILLLSEQLKIETNAEPEKH